MADDDPLQPLPPNLPAKYESVFHIIRFSRDSIVQKYGVSRLLVMPRQDYTLSFQLNDDGNRDVVSLVPPHTKHRQTLVEYCLRERPNQRLQWRVSPEEGVPISYVVDETSFSAIAEDAQRVQYHTQVYTILHVGGVLFCYLPMNSIVSFFSHFIQGWIISVHTLPEQASTDVLLSAVKVISQLAFPISLYNAFDSEELSREIDEENQRRKDICGQISGDFSELRHWSEVEEGVEDEKVSSVFRLEFRLTGTSSESDYLITLLDRKKPVSGYNVKVFYIPCSTREHKIAKRENHKFFTTLISPCSSVCRFLVVCPGEGVKVDMSTPDVKVLLGELLTALTPDRFQENPTDPMFKVLTRKDVKLVTKAMKACNSPCSLPGASLSSPTTRGLHNPKHYAELHRSPSDPNHDVETTFFVEGRT